MLPYGPVGSRIRIMPMMKHLLYDIAAFGRVPRLYQRFFLRDAASILMYHAVVGAPLPVTDWCFVDEPGFRQQMQYLKSFCHVVRLEEIGCLPAPSDRPVVALTFDDGFLNNFEVAFPILEALELPATIFLATDLVDSDDTVWFCRINDALAHTGLPRLEWDGAVHCLEGAEARARAGARLQASIKERPHPRMMQDVRAIVSALGDDPDKPIDRGSPYRMLGAAQIRAMQASGLVDFGAHTASHAILSLLPASERRRQIESSIQAVERLTQRPCRLFAYPNGRQIDFGATDIGILRQNAVAAAVTTVSGPNTRSVPDLELRRYGIGADTSMGLFQMLTHHLSWTLKH